MRLTEQESIPNLLTKNLPRHLVMAVEDALMSGARRAFLAAQGMDEGHLPHVVGQLRHFNMNEAFHRALSANAAQPTPIQGSSVISGQAGVFRVGRFNAKDALWNNARRSSTRRQMALANENIGRLVQPALFGNLTHFTEGTVFFVACFAASLRISPDAPLRVQVAVPDKDMRGWLFKESLATFLERYDQQAVQQHDGAFAKLRKDIHKKFTKDGTDQ